MDKPEIILVGGGGHCKSCIDVIEAEGRFIIKGIIDLPDMLGDLTLGYPVIGNDDDLHKLAKEGYNFLITLGHMGNPKRRKELFEIIKTNKGFLPVIKSPFARISKYSEIGDGTIIMHNCIINADAKIRENCIINNKALVEHDVLVESNCHISTDANINGNCTVFENVFVGSAATLKNGISIAPNVFIGAGSIVVKSIEKKGVYFGNPARKIISE